MTVARPEAHWPLILCGPMLRRVTPERVAVFVALRDAASVTLTVSEVDFGPPRALTQRALASADTIALGTRLHVVVVEAVVPAHDPLVPGVIYAYDVAVGLPPGIPGPPQDLAALGLLAGETPLGYEAGLLPTFALPPDLQYLRIVHGSCRKAHGEGTDMLPVVDSMIASSYRSALERPHQLLLTGDQIYADDVDPCLLTTLQGAAAPLLGWAADETLPGDSFGVLVPATDPRLAPGYARPVYVREHKHMRATTPESRYQLVDYRTRAEYMLSQTDLSSSECSAHLIFLADFLAMYLFAWSPELWAREHGDAPLSTTNPPTLASVAEMRARWPDRSAAGEARYANAQDHYAGEAARTRERTVAFAQGAARVRRALANVPTYMIFDDHEVTDDWNLHEALRNATRANPAGRQIIRNALLAYAVFQDWGNHPEHYAAGSPGGTLLDALTSAANTGRPPVLADPTAADTVLDIRPAPGTVAANERMHWHHVVVGPEHQVLMLDSRTWRAFPAAADGKAPAELISAPALDVQFEALADDPARLTIVVAATPVFGMNLVELGQSVMSRREGGKEDADAETWAGNSACYERLIRKLVGRAPVVLLTGDVHYGFAKHVLCRDSAPQGARARIVQFCASSLHNETQGTRALSAIAFTVPEPSRLAFSFGETPLPHVAARALMREVSNIFADAELAVTSAAVGETFARALISTHFGLEYRGTLGLPLEYDDHEGAEYSRVADLVEQFAPAGSTIWRRAIVGIATLGTLRVIRESTFAADPAALLPRRRLADVGWYSYVVGANNIGEISFDVGASGVPTLTKQTLYWYWPGASGQGHTLVAVDQSAPLTVDG